MQTPDRRLRLLATQSYNRSNTIGHIEDYTQSLRLEESEHMVGTHLINLPLHELDMPIATDHLDMHEDGNGTGWLFETIALWHGNGWGVNPCTIGVNPRNGWGSSEIGNIDGNGYDLSYDSNGNYDAIPMRELYL